MHQQNAEIEKLRACAARAATHAYSPYSQFPVGAAVLAGNGAVYSGCNVENASFGLTQCAERSALTAAIVDGVQPGDLIRLLIYTPGNQVHSPCGACRQVMQELMSTDSEVVSCCDTDELKTWSPLDYLPDPFTPESLNR